MRKRRLVIQAENDEEARLLERFNALARKRSGSIKHVVMGWIAAFVAAKGADNE